MAAFALVSPVAREKEPAILRGVDPARCALPNGQYVDWMDFCIAAVRLVKSHQADDNGVVAIHKLACWAVALIVHHAVKRLPEGALIEMINGLIRVIFHANVDFISVLRIAQGGARRIGMKSVR